MRQIGWLDAGLYGAARLLAKASHGRWALYKYRMVAQRISPESLCRGRGGRIEVALCRHPGELAPGFPRRPDVLDERYRQGAQCLAASRDGALLGFLWFSFGPYQEDEVRARFVPPRCRAAWDFDVQVLPEHQLGLAFARLWDEANALLRAHGVEWSCSRISAFNAASLAAHARIGTRLLGSALFLRAGGWQWMLSTLAPYFHVSTAPARYPTFHLEPPCSTSIQ